MKTILKLSLMLVMIFSTINLHANDLDVTLNVVTKEQGKKVTFALKEMNNVTLSIYNSSEELIFTEKITTPNSIYKTYDLKEFPAGTYYLERESYTKIYKYEITVTENTAVLTPKASVAVYKPTFVNKKGMVWISILNMDESPVNIKVYDKANNEVYDSDVKKENIVNKAFDINKIKDEEYTFVMTYKNKTFIKNVASN